MTSFITALSSLTWPGAIGFMGACLVIIYVIDGIVKIISKL